jgi:two-component system, NarL family, response regulator
VTTATLPRIGERSADRRKLAEIDYEGREIVPTPRELEVLHLVAAGFTNEEIATRLFLSPETVKRHISQGLYKLRATNRAHAVSICFRRGLFR